MSETPASPQQWYLLGTRFSPRDQLSFYTDGLQRDPAYHPWAECGLGLACCRLKRVEEGVAHFEAAINAAPDLVPAWYNLGLARMTLHDWTEAVDAFARAGLLDPANPAIAGNIARAQKQLARETQHARPVRLKSLPKGLIWVGLAGAILGFASLSWQYYMIYLVPFADFLAFHSTYSQCLSILGYARSACIGAGLVGLWLAIHRPRPWFLLLGLASLVITYFTYLLAMEGFYCEYYMLNTLYFGSYFAGVAMAWRGKGLPKVLLPTFSFGAFMSAILNYEAGCATFGPGYWQSPLGLLANAFYDIVPLFWWAMNLIWVVFWATILLYPPRAKARRRKGTPADMELEFA